MGRSAAIVAEPGVAPDLWVQVGPRGDKKWRDRGLGSPDYESADPAGTPRLTTQTASFALACCQESIGGPALPFFT